MRIAMLTWESLHSIAIGGVAAHVSELAAALQQCGHEVHVFTRLMPGQQNHDCIEGVHYHRCAYPFHHDFVDDMNNMCRAFVERVYLMEDYFGAFDIIHAHDWLAANAMIWIKQGRGRRSIFTIHSTEYARCGNVFHGGRSQRIREQERAGAYWADHVIAVSQATRDELGWMYEVPASKCTVVHNGVKPHRFDSQEDPGGIKRDHGLGPVDPTVLFCGRLDWQKGPDLLIEAVPFILKHNGSTKFVFVGDGPMRGGLEARTRQLGITDAVRFLGYRKGAELERLFRMADMVCVPSRNEPFGIVVLEAWSASKPVVVTQVGGPNEYVTHEVDGLKIYPRPDSIAWGLGAIFADFERARRMGVNGRRAVEERFTWPIIAEQTMVVYDPAGEHAVVAQPPVIEAVDRPEVDHDLTLEGSVELLLKPTVFTGSLRDVHSACREVLDRTELTVDYHDDRVAISGVWADVLLAVRRCHEALHRCGALRVESELTVCTSSQWPREGQGSAALDAAPDAVHASSLRAAGERQPTQEPCGQVVLMTSTPKPARSGRSNGRSNGRSKPKQTSK